MSDENGTTTISLPTGERRMLVAVPGVLGLGLGLVVPPVARWATGLPWIPWQGPLELVVRYAVGPGVWVLAVVGLVAGVIAGFALVEQVARVEVSERDVVVAIRSARRRWARSQVSLVLVEDQHLVLRGHGDEDLVREKLDVDAQAVLSAARAHGWPTG